MEGDRTARLAHEAEHTAREGRGQSTPLAMACQALLPTWRLSSRTRRVRLQLGERHERRGKLTRHCARRVQSEVTVHYEPWPIGFAADLGDRASSGASKSQDASEETSS
jgi:hypothetical protein